MKVNIMDRTPTMEVWNAAIDAAADLVRHHDDKPCIGYGGVSARRKLNQQELADAVLSLKSKAPERQDNSVTPHEAKAMEALSGLRDAMKAGITRNDEPHRVRLSDGSFVEGQAAVEWHALMNAIVDLADGVLGKTPAWRAYPGASWPDEPVEDDYVGSFGTLDEAKRECDRHKKGGFDDFVIHETTREVWRRRTGGSWACTIRARAS